MPTTLKGLHILNKHTQKINKCTKVKVGFGLQRLLLALCQSEQVNGHVHPGCSLSQASISRTVRQKPGPNELNNTDLMYLLNQVHHQ